MKKLYALGIVGFVGILILIGLSSEQAISYTSGAPEGRTGSPGDGDHCATSGCHANNPATPTGNEVVGLTTNIPLTGYIPGTIYDLTATMSDPAISKFGFEISPQNETGDILGSLIAGPETGLVGLSGYVTHTFSFTTGPGSRSWDFSWMAPEVGTGDVTFYGAYNFTNNNSQTSGDVVVLLDSTFTEDLTTEIANQASNRFNIYPNPVNREFRIDGARGLTRYQLFNLEGRVVQSGIVSIATPVKVDRSKVKAGIYFIRVNNKEHDEMTRFLVY